ncbi:thiazole tautomerase TenI [Neobacillus massiliamazoniensis]|nr:thiazole tautomerase TenI [Neobacillus massiliamazoniensis]
MTKPLSFSGKWFFYMKIGVVHLEILAITDDRHSVKELASIILKINKRIDYVHIRDKSKSVRELVFLLELLEEGGVEKRKIVLHDRLDLALIMGIPNIHLPGHGLPVKPVRERFPFMRIGCSVHSFKEACEAERDGANYVLYGHIYETNCKQGKTPKGLKELQEIKMKLDLPVYAIGGITPDKLAEIKKANTEGIAVMSGIFSAKNPEEAVLQYFQMCKEKTNEQLL